MRKCWGLWFMLVCGVWSCGTGVQVDEWGGGESASSERAGVDGREQVTSTEPMADAPSDAGIPEEGATTPDPTTREVPQPEGIAPDDAGTSRDEAVTPDPSMPEQAPEPSMPEQAPEPSAPEPAPEPSMPEPPPTEPKVQDASPAEQVPEPVMETVAERGVIQPGNPGQADISFAVHSQKEVHAISPYIYGTNQADWSGKTKGLTLHRLGGNRWTAYNWETNASNAGSDWNHQNDGYLESSNTPGEAVRKHIVTAHQAGAAALVTVPILGYVSADKNGGGDVNQTSNYLNVRFHKSHASKGSAFADPPNTTDKDVYQDEFVAWLKKKFPYAAKDKTRALFYSLDNEPDLWSHTHARLQSSAVGYQELLTKSITFAKGIKAVEPTALIFGPVSYGWAGYTTLQQGPGWNQNGDFLNYYLKEMAKASQQAGRRLLDVLDVHWYPEVRPNNRRITGDDTSAASVAARVQAPRSLWDPSYREKSWITDVIQQPIRLLPRLRDKIKQHYPGTRIAITEYYYGAGAHISGGVAQADVLGIFGREGIFAACLWQLGSSDHRFVYGAFAMYRNFDGSGGTFGDTSIQATSSDITAASIYASTDSSTPNRMVLVLLNKSTTSKSAGITISHTLRFRQAKVYQLTQASATPRSASTITLSQTNALRYTMPAMSVSTLVLTP